MERSGLTFMTHCWQFCERLVDDLFPLNLYLRLCWKALGKVLKKNWKRGENLKKYRGEFKFLFPSKFSSFQFFENESFRRERMFSIFEIFRERKDFENVRSRNNFFSAHIFWTPGINPRNSLFKHLPGINRQSEEECEWSNSSGIINHRFVLPMQIRSTIALTTMIMTTIIHRARVDCIFSP